jgi:phosphatidylinositol alpha-1,6-mannosyltransferase
MGILVITWNFPPRRGGIEYLLNHIAAGLGRRHSVAVVTSHSSGCREDRIWRAPRPGLIAFVFYALWRGARLLFLDSKKQIVFGGSALVTPLVLFLARVFGRKAVVQTHGLDLVYPSYLYQWLCVRWLKYCDQVVANSEYTAALAKNAGIPENRVAVIPPGIDPRRFAVPQDIESLRSRLGLVHTRIVLFVGRLARRKGVKQFIERCFAQLVREVPAARFVVAGDNPVESLTHRDDILSEIKQTVVRLGLQDSVRLLGAVDDEQLVGLYQIADVVVLPALPASNDVEGFGIVLLEAAAAGRPTVATRVGGIPDAVAHGEGGILVAPGDYEEMTRSLIRLLRNDDLRTALGRYGSNWVQEKFAWPKIIARYEQALGLAAAAER